MNSKVLAFFLLLYSAGPLYSKNDLSPALTCSADQFPCLDRLKCIPKSYLCDFYDDCDDASDEAESACVERCAADPSMFICKRRERTLLGGRLQKKCLPKKHAQCDGDYHCDDFSDEFPSLCDNCNRSGIAMCRDGSRCVKDEHLCNGLVHCADGSDESDTWSNCNFCREEGSVPCPGFPGNCAKVCDGIPTCPDNWDELLSTCNEYKVSCSKEDGLFECSDGSSCVAIKGLCDSEKDCADGEDENAEQC